MSFNPNPMGITGPTSPAWKEQNDYRAPVVNANVVSYPIATNVLLLTWPLPIYVNPVSVKDDPQGTIRGGR
jgi:hypothetical protein